MPRCCFKAGVPIKVVRERLGHATASFTLDVYGWVLPGMQAEAAAAFSRLLASDASHDGGSTSNIGESS